MKLKRTSVALCAVGMGAIAAAAATVTVQLTAGSDPAPATVQIVTGGTATPTASVGLGIALLPQSQGSVTSADGGAVRPTNLPVSDIVYFGAAWTSLELNGSNPAFVLGNGYRNPTIVRDPLDNTFIAGTVEKADAAGRVTDVILTFTGSATPSRDDITDVGLLIGTGDPQTKLAEQLFDRIMTDSRYVDATIHVTGHSMGSALATWLFAHSIATYGKQQTYARVSAVLFAAPPWGTGALSRFGLTQADFYNRVQNYAAQNDVIMAAGLVNLGVQHRLQPYEPLTVGSQSLGPANYSIGHHPIAVILGVGLPAWLSQDQKTAILTSIGVNPVFDAWQRAYGANGTVAKTVYGDAGADWIEGSDAGDVIIGGAGADVLTGRRGGDRFVYRVGDSTAADTDTILDFNPAEGDTIDLRQIGGAGNGRSPSGLRFVGSSPSGASGEVFVSWSGADTILAARVGNGNADLVIRLAGHLNLSAANVLT